MATYTITYKVSPSNAGYWSGVTSPQQIGTPQYYNLNSYYVYQRYDRNKYYLYLKGYNNDQIVTTAIANANSGYSFKGLSISGCKDEKIAGNVTVTATFTYSSFNVIYYPNLTGQTGFTPDYVVKIPYQIKSISSLGWSINHYKFNNWTTEADGSGTLYNAGKILYTRPGDQLYLYAQWTANKYNINFTHNAGGTTNPSGSNQYAYNSSCEVTAIPSQDYYYLDRWELVWSDGGSRTLYGDSTSFTVEGSATIKAIFDKKSYTLSVKASPSAGGTVGGGGTAKYGSYLNIWATANLGYKFDHWEGDDGGYGTGSSRNVKLVGKTTYTAYFTPKTYTVKLNVNGGKWLEEQPNSTFINGNTKTFDDKSILVSNVPYRFGYKFDGWGWRKDNASEFTYIYDGGGEFDDKAYRDLGGTTTQITLYAVWTPIKNTIKYHYYTGDTASDIEIIDTDTYTIETPNPYKYYDPKNQRGENSTFLGWARVKPNNWGEASQEGHGNYPIPLNVPVLYDLPYEVNISNIKDTTQDNSQWGTTVDVYGFWTVTGKYININGTWKKVNTAYIRTDTGWKVITDMYVNIGDSDNPNWKHEVTI